MKKSFPFTMCLLLSGTLIMLSAQRVCGAVGEPVPGAEVFVELEPDDAPVAHFVTNAAGVVTGEITLKAPVRKNTILKISIKYPKGVWKPLATKFNKASLVGTYSFRRTLKVGGKSLEGKMTTQISTPEDTQAKSAVASGPYSESLSNIEDNLAPNATYPRKIPFTFTLMCTGVDK